MPFQREAIFIVWPENGSRGYRLEPFYGTDVGDGRVNSENWNGIQKCSFTFAYLPATEAEAPQPRSECHRLRDMKKMAGYFTVLQEAITSETGHMLGYCRTASAVCGFIQNRGTGGMLGYSAVSFPSVLIRIYGIV